MQKAIIYCRVSSERQKNEGHGLESQEHRCREYASQKNYLVEHVFRDSFTGGGDFARRPAMSEMVEYLDSKPYNSYIVIFDDIKRLARDTEQHLKLRQLFQRRGVKVECPNFVFDDSPEGKYVETIMAATAELERQQNRRQVLQKMKARLEAGYWCFPDLPIGYEFKKDPVHGKIPVSNEKAEIIKEALEGYASGRFQDKVDVQRFLQSKDIKDGKPVYPEFVSRFLQKIFYAGYIEYPEWEVPRLKAHHTGIISLETFENIQSKLNGKKTTHVKKILNPDFPLRTFVLCSCCYKPLTGSWSKGRNGKFAYYRCKEKACIEEGKSIRKVDIEERFEYILSQIKPNDNILTLAKAILFDVWKKRLESMEGQKNRIKTDIKRLETEREVFLQRVTRSSDERLILVYESKIAEFSDNIEKLNNLLFSIQKNSPNIETALDIVFDFLKNPLSEWKKGDMRTKKLILQLIFEGPIVYSRKNGFETVNLSLPLRLFTLSEVQNSRVVDIVSENWNLLHSWVLEASSAILERISLQKA